MSKQKIKNNQEYFTTAPEALQSKVESLQKEAFKILNEINSFSLISESAVSSACGKMDEGINLKKEMKNLEIRLIKRALEISLGNQTSAAKLLNIKLTTLNNKIKRNGILRKGIMIIE